MSGIEWGGLMFAVLLLLMALRIHIGVAMLLTGTIGYTMVAGWDPLMSFFKNAAFARYSSYDLSVVPLFLLMGQFATNGGLSKALFKAGNAMIGHWRGGMAMAAVTSCAGFGAICGSSLATAATMGQVALPELKAHHYSERLSAAVIAAGGTLGILIPPSVPLVIYAIITEQNIAKMFLAAFVPGIIAAIGYMLVIAIIARVSPQDAPRGVRFSWSQRLSALAETWPVLLIFFGRDRRHLRWLFHADRSGLHWHRGHRLCGLEIGWLARPRLAPVLVWRSRWHGHDLFDFVGR